MPKAPARVPVTLADMRKKREIVALAPSGLTYKIRPINLERHALSGGLPARLRSAAMKGQEGVNELLGTEDEATMTAEGESVKTYLDLLVAETIVEPSLWQHGPEGEILRDEEGLKAVDPDAIDAVPPTDYKWALGVAFGEVDRDGEDRLMWGREPLSKWATFRVFHGCSEDCEGCSDMLRDLSPAV